MMAVHHLRDRAGVPHLLLVGTVRVDRINQTTRTRRVLAAHLVQ
jgi:hypothetical protein